MRLEERCKCGAEIVLVFESGRRSSYTSSEMDGYVAQKQLDTWRRRHKDCHKGATVTHSVAPPRKDENDA
jgi:hypothetical protein